MPLNSPVSWFGGASLMVISIEPDRHLIRTLGSTAGFEVEATSASAAAIASLSELWASSGKCEIGNYEMQTETHDAATPKIIKSTVRRPGGCRIHIEEATSRAVSINHERKTKTMAHGSSI